MTKRGTLLAADDNRNILASIKMLMENTFKEIITVSNPAEIPAALRNGKPEVVLLDMNFKSGINNGNEGLYWLREIKRLRPSAQVVLFTAYADIELAVNGIKEGAADFIVKPFTNAKMTETLISALDKSQGKNTKRKESEKTSMFWGESPVMQQLHTLVDKVASTDANILITGENGTGKEMLANEIHHLSPRSDAPMVAIDMGAITETLFESELFGHVKGAFTDAGTDKTGKFEVAENGTLFLDEIGNLSYSLQAKLLSAIQRKTITKVGDTKPIPINVRLICATNRDLNDMVSKGLFREDLLYRINTIHIRLPALRERKEDIAPLAGIFLKKYGGIYAKPDLSFDESAITKLKDNPWPGNIRELEHTVEKTVILCDSSVIKADDIDSSPQSVRIQSSEQKENGTLEDMEKEMIVKAIGECKGNLSVTAGRLGITRQTLYNKIKKYGI
ncbi:MAG: sigma-54 dependent transcriptional regulator [Bacteroidales bacterium]|jgi:DNA-binding NtrC family response regulator|nr:sigma-54 dependent transcriptional regulator [Bacteroidales bacterium]MCI1784667.1 sigma-54 dependent transcriptional regulator [Bacteroidales bacterium]